MYDGLTLVNLTPHAIVIATDDTTLTIQPSGTIARVTVDTVMTAPGLYTTVHGHVDGLPDPVDGTIYIVSAMVLGACTDRPDVYAPATALAQRNDAGHIISVPGLTR